MGSGLSTFQPTIAEIVLAAYARLQIRRTEITNEHLVNARLEANLLQVQWGNQGPNLWAVDQQQLQVVSGQGVYEVAPDTIEILDAYFSLGLTAPPSDASADASADANIPGSQVVAPGAVSVWTDRIVTGIGRSEYLSIPNKQVAGLPSTFWFEKGTNARINFWPVPDAAGLFTYWRSRQIQDAVMSEAGTSDIPYLWVDASVAGLAHRLARIYKPEVEAARKADAQEAWRTAAAQDVESVPWNITPDLSGYYR